MGLHPAFGVGIVAIRPFHAVAKNNEQFCAFKQVGVDGREIGGVVDVEPGFFEDRSYAGVGLFGLVISISAKEYRSCR